MCLWHQGGIADYKGSSSVMNSCSKLCMLKVKMRIPILCHYYFRKLLGKHKCMKLTASLGFLKAKAALYTPIISSHKVILFHELAGRVG